METKRVAAAEERQRAVAPPLVCGGAVARELRSVTRGTGTITRTRSRTPRRWWSHGRGERRAERDEAWSAMPSGPSPATTCSGFLRFARPLGCWD